MVWLNELISERSLGYEENKSQHFSRKKEGRVLQLENKSEELLGANIFPD